MHSRIIHPTIWPQFAYEYWWIRGIIAGIQIVVHPLLNVLRWSGIRVKCLQPVNNTIEIFQVLAQPGIKYGLKQCNVALASMVFHCLLYMMFITVAESFGHRIQSSADLPSLKIFWGAFELTDRQLYFLCDTFCMFAWTFVLCFRFALGLDQFYVIPSATHATNKID